MAKLVQELYYIQQLINEMVVKEVTNFIVFCDNQSAIESTRNPTHHAQRKHIDIKLCYVREYVQKKLLQLEYINTLNQVADVFTKPLDTTKFNKFKHCLNIKRKAF